MCEGEIKIIKKKTEHYKEIKLYKQLSLKVHETKLTEIKREIDNSTTQQ